MTSKVKIGNVTVGGGEPLVLIAGPCVIEGADRTLKNALSPDRRRSIRLCDTSCG